MKFIYKTMLVVVIVLTTTIQIASAQTTLYYEDFTTAAYKVTLTDPWQWVDTDPSPGSGGHYIETAVPNNPGNSTNVYTITLEVNTVDYKDIQVAWLERNLAGTQGNKSPDIRSLYYRTGGSGAFLLIATYESSDSITWESQLKSLGVYAQHIEQLELQWVIDRPKGSTRRLAIDDITVTGTFVEPIDPNPFPVELSSFQGQSLNGNVKLAWATATETNNEKFVVERSQDGSNFSLVGEVKGSGNSATRLTYNFTDKTPADGVNYYRLRQVDTDGTINYSSVVAMQVSGNMSLSVYPTLATSAVTIRLEHTSDKAMINITDITGKTVVSFRNSALRELELPVNHFKSGLYYVRVTDGQNQQVQRFLKQ